MMKQLSVLILALFAIAACDSNPYSNGGDKIPPTESKPGDGNGSSKAYTLDVPVTVTCTEGSTCSFYIHSTVQGEASVITFENLPPEAYYDARLGLVTWTPPIVSTGGGIAKVHVVLVNLRGETDAVTGLQKTVVFVVNGRS